MDWQNQNAETIAKQAVSGDFAFSALIGELLTVSGANAGLNQQHNAAGLMFLASDALSPMVLFVIRQETPVSHTGRRHHRSSQDGAIIPEAGFDLGGAYPGGTYIHIERTGNTISVFTSPDGSTKTEIGTALSDDDFALDGFLCLFVTDGTASDGCQVEFTNTSIS